MSGREGSELDDGGRKGAEVIRTGRVPIIDREPEFAWWILEYAVGLDDSPICLDRNDSTSRRSK